MARLVKSGSSNTEHAELAQPINNIVKPERKRTQNLEKTRGSVAK